MEHFIFPHDSPLHHYEAAYFIVRCFDDRFRSAFEAFIQSKKVEHYDPESVAGGVKIIASPEQEPDRDFILRELEKSIRLHNTGKIMLFSHHDCGAYGGFSKFENNAEQELLFHGEEHKKARAIISEKFPNMQIESYFINEQGIIALPL